MTGSVETDDLYDVATRQPVWRRLASKQLGMKINQEVGAGQPQPRMPPGGAPIL